MTKRHKHKHWSDTMIHPTIGRVIWLYRLVDSESGDQPEVGLITYVHNDFLINVAGFNKYGNHFAVSNVPLVQDTSDSDINVVKPYATWMPYQKGHAAKPEELEKELSDTPSAAPPSSEPPASEST
jgi:hypothetical protein